MSKAIYFVWAQKTVRIVFSMLLAIFLCGEVQANPISPKEIKADILTIMTQKKVSLNMTNASIKSILQEIRRQTDLNFLYKDDEIGNINAQNINVNQMTVEEALAKILSDSGLTYSIVGDGISIYKSAPKKTEQQRKISVKGRVLSADDNAPIAGATVLVVGSTDGAITDDKGNFSFMAFPNAKLEISYVGMKTVIYEKPLDTNAIVIKMQKDAMAVDDVVVTGYFNKSSNLFTGAVKTIKKEEIQKFGNAGVLNVLAMSDPSFKIKENINAGSDPNALPEFFVRGEGSFMGDSNLPTFIVDGYEVSLNYVLDMDIDRIESLSILKDASATVFYGSRAANGVVVIETRRPELGKLIVSYNNKTSLSVPDLSDYNLMNAAEKLDYEVRAGVWKGTTPENQYIRDIDYQKIYSNIVSGVDTYWLSKPIRNAVSHSHSLYVSGGNEVVTYGINGSYNKNVGVIKGSSKETYSVGFDLSYRIKEKINIKNSFLFTNNKAENSPYGSFSNYTTMNPYEKIYDAKGDYIVSYERNNYTIPNYLYNASLRHLDENATSTIINNLSIDYNIAKGLRLQGSLALNKSLGHSDYYVSPLDAMFANTTKMEEKGLYTMSNSNGFSYNANIQLSYNLVFGKNNLYAGVGANIQDEKSVSKTVNARGFVDEDFYDISFALGYDDTKGPQSINTRSRLVGFLGNINYSFDNRYFVDFSGRLDGSSKYGSEKRFAPLWSAGIGWNLNNEKFLKNSKVVEVLKIRGSIGATGNQNFDPTQSRMTYKYWNNDTYYNSVGVSFVKYGNRDLAWQQTLKRNVGLDFITMKRRVSFTFNYYNDVTDGLLLPVTVAPSLGFTSYIENYGEQSNKGIEFDLNASVVRNKNLDIAISLSGNHNVNKITKISSALAALNETENSKKENFTRPVAMYEEGESLTSLKAVQSLGINPETGNEIFLKKNGQTTEIWDYRDKVKVGDTAAKLSGSIGLNIIYKAFSVNANMLYSIGGDAYNKTLAERVEGAEPKANADKRVLEERWKQPGDITFFKNIADKTVSNLTSRFVQRNNYIDMGNIAVSYRFNRDAVKKIGMSNLKLSINMNNVFHISTIKRERGLDYPFARQFTFSLNVNF